MSRSLRIGTVLLVGCAALVGFAREVRLAGENRDILKPRSVHVVCYRPAVLATGETVTVVSRTCLPF